MSGSSLAFSMNRRAVTTRDLRRAGTPPAEAGPAEKLSIAGTRDSACSAKKVTTAAREVGSRHADAFAGSRPAASAPPSARARGDQTALAHRLSYSMSSTTM